ncbi:flavodoxin [Vibrio salinus]|uniref:flavodoxin n=1 Tax=Vibrio salinus TaxID=2899784 RepID=UPI001E60770C|nr:flavodoxin [Vibrio salinus]MCE0496069.1 flavodoxin [Vibrio salinus]
MADEISLIVETKNEWLRHQIEVEFPTKASLKGYHLQLERSLKCEVIAWTPSEQPCLCPFELFPVNFHRLTVYFAIMQSKRFALPEEQESIIEFYTQIIYSEPCQLYVGFREQEPVFACMVTKTGNQVLFSNFVSVDPTYSLSDNAQFIYDFLFGPEIADCSIYIEDCDSSDL